MVAFALAAGAGAADNVFGTFVDSIVLVDEVTERLEWGLPWFCASPSPLPLVLPLPLELNVLTLTLLEDALPVVLVLRMEAMDELDRLTLRLSRKEGC